jgi:hypothetical protein
MIARFLLLVASTTIALLFGEFAIRVLAPQDLGIFTTTRHGLIVHPPNLEVYSSRHGQTVRTNSLGMRDREHRLERGEDGAFRVLLLGDSFMEALQVSFEESFPSRLERELQQRVRRPVEVINASVSGWGTDDELTYLTRYGLALKPDLVLIAMTLHNDVSDNLRVAFHELRDGSLYEKPREAIPLLRYGLLRTRIFLASHSHLYQLVWRAWQAREHRAKAAGLNEHVAQLIRQEPDEETLRGWTLTHRLLEKTGETADRVGAELAVFLIPLSMQLSDERLELFLSRHGVDAAQIEPEAPQQAMRAWASDRDVQVIDLLPGFRERAIERPKSLYLESDGHWTAEGHGLAAQLVSKELLSLGLLD